MSKEKHNKSAVNKNYDTKALTICSDGSNSNYDPSNNHYKPLSFFSRQGINAQLWMSQVVNFMDEIDIGRKRCEKKYRTVITRDVFKESLRQLSLQSQVTVQAPTTVVQIQSPEHHSLNVDQFLDDLAKRGIDESAVEKVLVSNAKEFNRSGKFGNQTDETAMVSKGHWPASLRGSISIFNFSFMVLTVFGIWMALVNRKKTHKAKLNNANLKRKGITEIAKEIESDYLKSQNTQLPQDTIIDYNNDKKAKIGTLSEAIKESAKAKSESIEDRIALLTQLKEYSCSEIHDISNQALAGIDSSIANTIRKQWSDETKQALEACTTLSQSISTDHTKSIEYNATRAAINNLRSRSAIGETSSPGIRKHEEICNLLATSNHNESTTALNDCKIKSDKMIERAEDQMRNSHINRNILHDFMEKVAKCSKAFNSIKLKENDAKQSLDMINVQLEEIVRQKENLRKKTTKKTLSDEAHKIVDDAICELQEKIVVSMAMIPPSPCHSPSICDTPESNLSHQGMFGNHQEANTDHEDDTSSVLSESVLRKHNIKNALAAQEIFDVDYENDNDDFSDGSSLDEFIVDTKGR